MEDFILYNGMGIPSIGLGTYPMKGEVCRNAVESAARVGYRLFDTAAAYGNEKDLGPALRKNFCSRTHYFVMTKLSNRQQDLRNVRKALTESLQSLRLDYIDIYLLHWPNPGTYLECYQQMEELQKEGLVRAIGVSNFHVHHLENLLKYATIKPALNQVELHPLLSQEKLARFCGERGIKMVSYTPFARMDERLIKNHVLMEIARKHNVKTTQVIVRWNYQHGYIAIPKSAEKERQRENISIDGFSLNEDEMSKIDRSNEDYRVRYNPDSCDFTKL